MTVEPVHKMRWSAFILPGNLKISDRFCLGAGDGKNINYYLSTLSKQQWIRVLQLQRLLVAWFSWHL